MLNFDSVEDLVSHMFEKLDDENHLASVISNKEMTIEIVHELLNYNNVILNSCEIDDAQNYDREYLVSLFDDVDSDNWYVSVEKSYLEEKNKYLAIDGYVLFHEDVNSKAIIDMQNNEFMPLGDHDWFTVGESDFNDEDKTEPDENAVDNNPLTTSLASYKINGKEVSKDIYESELEKIEGMYLDNMRDMLLGYADFMDEMNEWRKLFRW